MAQSSERPFMAKLGHAILQYRATIIALLALMLGVVLLFVANNIDQARNYGEVLDRLVDSGVDPSDASDQLNALSKGQFPSTILWALGGTLTSIGIVSMAWDVTLTRPWLAHVTETLREALVDPATLSHLSRAKAQTALKKLQISIHGQRLGEALYSESESAAKFGGKIRRDFRYEVLLSTSADANYNTAKFSISFILPSLPKDPAVSFAQVDDSLQFHTRYKELVATQPNVIYRYVLLSRQRGVATKLFKLDNCTVSSLDGTQRLTLTQNLLTKDADAALDINLGLPRRPDKKLRQLLAGECRVTLFITTVVDARRNEFPIVFGYPVDAFRTRLDAGGVGAQEIDVLEFFTSSKRFRREDFATESPEHLGITSSTTIASGVIDDIILPDSGLTYIWR